MPWHTGDYNLDQIYPNSRVCPRLNNLEDTIYASEAWLEHLSSAALVNLNQQLDAIFGKGYWDWGGVLDCLMTTVCTDREIPDGPTGSGAMSQSIFDNTVKEVEFRESFLNVYNNSQWSKLAMGNTAWHVRTNLDNIMKRLPTSFGSAGPLRFALFSGHDTTIIPFLAAILGDSWDGLWPGYVSAVTIELYSAKSGQSSSGYLFRVVYNGQVQKVPGCVEELCDAQILLNALSFGQEKMPCSAESKSKTSDDDAYESCYEESRGLSGIELVAVVLISILTGIVSGAAAVILTEKRRKETLTNRINDENLQEDSVRNALIA